MENILIGTLIGLVLGGGIAYVIARSVFNDKLKMINDKNTEVLDLKGFKDEIAALKGTTETIHVPWGSARRMSDAGKSGAVY